jgi:hypothetical protein
MSIVTVYLSLWPWFLDAGIAKSIIAPRFLDLPTLAAIPADHPE